MRGKLAAAFREFPVADVLTGVSVTGFLAFLTAYLFHTDFEPWAVWNALTLTSCWGGAVYLWHDMRANHPWLRFYATSMIALVGLWLFLYGRWGVV